MNFEEMQRLTARIAAMPGVLSVDIVNASDPQSWRISFRSGATSEQKRAATDLLSVDPTAPTSEDLRNEYERRLFEILGARDLAHAGFIQAHNNSELRDLGALSSRSDEQETWLQEVIRINASVSLLIERYNAVPDPVPRNYKADSWWE